ncbi:MAG: hypothetical protein U9Q79_08980, partial [Candidatus Hydrogenedentes bacterium]|nr:hypothetical protein [Candidatus Hydrogenedentota bacterium]
MSTSFVIPKGWEVVPEPEAAIPEGWEVIEDDEFSLEPFDAPVPVTREEPPAQPQLQPPARPVPQQAPAEQPPILVEYGDEIVEFPYGTPNERIERVLQKDMADQGKVELTPEQTAGRSRWIDSEEHGELRAGTPLGQKGLEEYAEFLSGGEDDDGNPVVVNPEDVTPQALAGMIEARVKLAEDAAKEENIDPVALREFIEDTEAMERDVDRPWANETTAEDFTRRYVDKMTDAEVIESAKARPGTKADITADAARQMIVEDRLEARTPEVVAADEAILDTRPGYVARKDQPTKASWAESLLREYRHKYGEKVPWDKKLLFDRANETYDAWLKGQPGGTDEGFDAWR